MNEKKHSSTREKRLNVAEELVSHKKNKNKQRLRQQTCKQQIFMWHFSNIYSWHTERGGKISQNSDRFRNYMQPGCIFNHRSKIKAKDFGNELEMEMNTLHQFDMHGRAREKTEEENNN